MSSGFPIATASRSGLGRAKSVLLVDSPRAVCWQRERSEQQTYQHESGAYYQIDLRHRVTPS